LSSSASSRQILDHNLSRHFDRSRDSRRYNNNTDSS